MIHYHKPIMNQAQSFKADIDKLVNRYSEEFDLNVAEAIGVLVLVIFDLFRYVEKDAERSGDRSE